MEQEKNEVVSVHSAHVPRVLVAVFIVLLLCRADFRKSFFSLFDRFLPFAEADGDEESSFSLYSELGVASLGSRSEVLRMMSFNAQFLNDEDGKGLFPRQERDYEAIASVISWSYASVAFIQEVENQKAVERICPDGYLARSGRLGRAQDLAFVWDPAKVDLLDFRELSELSDDDFSFTRPPLVAEVLFQDRLITVLNLHIRRTRDQESRVRACEEIRRIVEWIVEHDAVALGDWNVDAGKFGYSSRVELFSPQESTLVSGNGEIDFLCVPKKEVPVLIINRVSLVFNRQVWSQFRISDHAGTAIDFKVGD